jgi:hypothetical protein
VNHEHAGAAAAGGDGEFGERRPRATGSSRARRRADLIALARRSRERSSFDPSAARGEVDRGRHDAGRGSGKTTVAELLVRFLDPV